MSREQVEAFYAKVMQDEELKQKVMAIKGAPEAVGNAVVELAKEEGFDVTLDDYKALYYENNEEMSDEELAQVSGGGGLQKGCPDYNSSCSKNCDEICGMNLGHYIGKQR